MDPAATERAVDAALRKSNASSERTIKRLRAALEEAMKVIISVTAKGFEGSAISADDVKAVMENAASQIAQIAESRVNLRRAELCQLENAANSLVTRLKKVLETEEEVKIALDVKRNEPVSVLPVLRSQRPPNLDAESNGNGNLSRPQMALIRALAEAEAIGRSPIGRSWLAFIAGVSPKSSGFEKNVSTLRTGGYVDYGSAGTVQLTNQGRAIAPAIEIPLTTDDPCAAGLRPSSAENRAGQYPSNQRILRL